MAQKAKSRKVTVAINSVHSQGATAESTVNNASTRAEASHSTSILACRTVAEFFAGIGLMRMGLENQGWRVIVANDIDEQKQQMYNEHFQDKQHFLLEDVHKLQAETIPTVSLATASFPCTDLSLAGGRTGLDGKQSSAFWGFRTCRKTGIKRPEKTQGQVRPSAAP